MDNVTHSLTGLMLARAGLNRWIPGATAVLLISANIPDIDIVAFAGGPLAYLEAHRGYTHSLLCLPIMALLSVLLASAVMRRRIALKAGFLLAVIGVASHLLLDWTNSYGIRLLLPFSSRWFHLDWDVLTDYLLLGVLAFAFVWPYFARLVTSEIGARRSFGRVLPTFALGSIVLLEAMRALTHAKSIAQLNTVLYGGAPAIEVAALPTPLNPWLWRIVVETPGDFETGSLNLLLQSEPAGLSPYLKLPQDVAVRAALQTEPFRYFEYFARFPVWSEQPGATSGPPTTRLELTDLRFGEPGAGSFHSVALVNAQQQVVESEFTFGDGQNLGWAADVTMKQK